jgi:AcrR family transcriptional regulator
MTMPEPKNKRAEIQEAAARLFRDKGYAATSMRDLARAVDIKASSIYNHFESKEDILRQICFDNAHRFLEGLQEVERAEDSATNKLRTLINLHIQIATEDVTSITAFNDEWRHLNEPFLNEFKAIRRDYEHRFQAIIEDGMRKGELRPIDPHIATYTLFSSIRWLYDWYKSGKSISTDDLQHDISSLLMKGLSM